MQIWSQEQVISIFIAFLDYCSLFFFHKTCQLNKCESSAFQQFTDVKEHLKQKNKEKHEKWSGVTAVLFFSPLCSFFFYLLFYYIIIPCYSYKLHLILCLQSSFGFVTIQISDGICRLTFNLLNKPNHHYVIWNADYYNKKQDVIQIVVCIFKSVVTINLH